ncbi:MAG: SpoIID/LytB domain-containing protein [Calditrichaeota bacterium]|nr:MAG: SpoIID/LytB domain-containing protein [Calditrichota bacterium]
MRLHRFFRMKICVGFALVLMLWQCAPQLRHTAPAVEEVHQPEIRICLDDSLREATLRFDGNFLLELEEARYWFDETIGELNVSVRGEYLVIKNDKRFFELTTPLQVVFQPQYEYNTFYWNDIPYSGKLLLYLDKSHRLVINQLPVEKYLEGVVPFEMPTQNPEYREAIFAQTIAARTYAWYAIEHPENEFYHLFADERDQVYRGKLRSSPLIETAIKKTRGKVLALNDHSVRVQFHSTCGGILEVRSDSESTNGNPNTITMAYDLMDNEFNCKISPKYRWVEVRTAETVLQNLKHEFQLDSSLVQKWLDEGFHLTIEVVSRKPGGRVNQLRLVVNEREFLVDGYRIRAVLRDDVGEMLPSELFFINQSPTNPGKFYIVGAGYGHGRGMCQWGAIGMSLRGYNYHRILNFYYPELSIKTLYQ